MLRNLSAANKENLRHLFNRLLARSYVPEQWKKAIETSLLKQGKPAEDPNSYRPVSLTSCLCKTFERNLSQRLHWYLETQGLINVEQAGFRKGCSTTDHIAQLDTDIKTSFNENHSTVAVFLDISKAYDTVWVQGLIYKMATIGITGHILGWIEQFLTGRSFRVRIGKYVSSPMSV
jgi:hypothetical protein